MALAQRAFRLTNDLSQNYVAELRFVHRCVYVRLPAVRRVDDYLEFNNLVRAAKGRQPGRATGLLVSGATTRDTEREPANRVEKETGGLAADEGLHCSKLDALTTD